MNTIWIAVGALALLGLVFGAFWVMPPADSRLKMIRLLKKLMPSCHRASADSAAIQAAVRTPKR